LVSAGLAAQAKGDDAQADADYLAALKKAPTDTLAWYNLGVVAGGHGDAAGAAHDYEHAIAADRAYAPALYNLAILLTAKEPRTAEGLYERVLAVSPDEARAELNLGFVLRTLGQKAKGNADIAKAVKLDPALGRRAANG
jgi:tetratricopeptide (TPR) repeat protein